MFGFSGCRGHPGEYLHRIVHTKNAVKHARYVLLGANTQAYSVSTCRTASLDAELLLRM